MDVSSYLVELYGRLPDLVHAAVDDLDERQLATPPGDGVNTIAWLVWHLTRVQDHHVSELMEAEQVYLDGGWAERFGLAADPDDIGYGHDADEVAAVRPDGPDALTGYYDAVWARTRAYLAGLGPADLDRVVDRRWDPPVTLAVRLVSIADDDIQHAGQAAYLKGLLAKR